MAGLIEMAGNTQYFGVTYPTSTDFVKDGAVAIETVADGFDSAVAIPTYNNQTGTTYTFVLLDAAKVVSSNNAAAVTFTIPPQTDVVWEAGTTLTVANYGAGAVTIAAGSGVTVTNSGATVGQFASASVIRTGSNAWTVIPFAGGVALLSDSAISGTTGSPTTATYTDGGINYKTYSFTGSGSITSTADGLLDIMVVSGGGGSSGSTTQGVGGGGGSAVMTQSIYLPADTTTVTIGAGGTGTSTGFHGTTGTLSTFGVVVDTALAVGLAGGGGSGGNTATKNGLGGSSGGGGGGDASSSGGTALVSGLGFAGGNGASFGGGGGGGASALGVDGVGGGVAGAGGAGSANTFRLGTSETYGGGGGGRGTTTSGAGGAGGGGGLNTNGTANTGGGAGGSNTATGKNGGSGLIVIRVLA